MFWVYLTGVLCIKMRTGFCMMRIYVLSDAHSYVLIKEFHLSRIMHFVFPPRPPHILKNIPTEELFACLWLILFKTNKSTSTAFLLPQRPNRQNLCPVWRQRTLRHHRLLRASWWQGETWGCLGWSLVLGWREMPHFLRGGGGGTGKDEHLIEGKWGKIMQAVLHTLKRIEGNAR